MSFMFHRNSHKCTRCSSRSVIISYALPVPSSESRLHRKRHIEPWAVQLEDQHKKWEATLYLLFFLDNSTRCPTTTTISPHKSREAKRWVQENITVQRWRALHTHSVTEYVLKSLSPLWQTSIYTPSRGQRPSSHRKRSRGRKTGSSHQGNKSQLSTASWDRLNLGKATRWILQLYRKGIQCWPEPKSVPNLWLKCAILVLWPTGTDRVS